MLADLGKDLRAEKYAPYQILVEGHTDGVAIRGPLAERYPTNWELAGARAARVVRALEEAGVDGDAARRGIARRARIPSRPTTRPRAAPPTAASRSA